MNRSLFASILAALILSGFHPAEAAVEPRLAGTWTRVDSAGQTVTFSIEPGGRYSKAVNGGRIVETGRLQMVDGNWMTCTESGRSEKGTFSIIGGKLVLRGGSAGTTDWVQVSKQASAVSATRYGKAEDITRATIPTAPFPVSKIASPGDSRNYRALSRNLNQMNHNNQMSPRARSFGHGNTRSGLANMTNYAATSGGVNMTQPSLPVPSHNDAASGRSSLSAKIRAQQALQLSAMPAAKVVQAAPNSDESTAYGSRSLESKAFGPPRVIRIKVGAPPI
ncbi:hypothetical protein GC174_16075 [bacterium]|nr:hypothetical protein [bacterium]